MSLLFMRFISWFKVGKNRTLLLFSISALAVNANSIMIVIFSYLALLNIQQVMNPFIPSFTNMMFNIPIIKSAYLTTTTFQFLLLWIATVLILKPFGSRIGPKKFWILITIPVIFFISKYQFYQLWLSNFLIAADLLSPVSYFRFASIFEVSTNVVGALMFGMAYWIVSRGISDNTLKRFVQISGVGICLFFLSSQITNLTLIPYPPFGLVSISFVSISSYLLFSGLYQAAMITSKNSVIRSLMNKGTGNELRFIGNIGTSEMKQSITSQLKGVIQKYKDDIENGIDATSPDLEQDVKAYVAMALNERRKYIQSATLPRLFKREENPLGTSWEKWVELWWQWCYSFPKRVNPLSDLSGEYAKNGKISEYVWFLAGTFGGKAHRTCILSKETAIFFPILNNIITYYTDPQLKTRSDLDAYAKIDLDHIISLSANVDGHVIPNLNSYRVHSDLFTIDFPDKKEEKLYVRTEAISDGYWIFLKPLSPGKHTIEFTGQKLEFDKIKDYHNFSIDEINGLPKFRVEVTYNIDVR